MRVCQSDLSKLIAMKYKIKIIFTVFYGLRETYYEIEINN